MWCFHPKGRSRRSFSNANPARGEGLPPEPAMPLSAERGSFRKCRKRVKPLHRRWGRTYFKPENPRRFVVKWRSFRKRTPSTKAQRNEVRPYSVGEKPGERLARKKEATGDCFVLVAVILRNGLLRRRAQGNEVRPHSRSRTRASSADPGVRPHGPATFAKRT
jgi:hypothetical protein